MEFFRTVVADPSWPFNDKLPGPGRGAARHYREMSIEEIYRFPLPAIATDSRLFLWTVAAMPEEGVNTMIAWGFRPVCEIIWIKLTVRGKPWFGMGRTVRNAHERCLVGVRGKPEVLNHSTRSVFYARAGKHSEKPKEFFDLVEGLSPGPYVELFARSPRPGWTCQGDELPETFRSGE